MVSFGPDREDRGADIGQGRRSIAGEIASFGEVVVEEQTSQIFRVRPVGIRVASAFQAIRSVIGARSPIK